MEIVLVRKEETSNQFRAFPTVVSVSKNTVFFNHFRTIWVRLNTPDLCCKKMKLFMTFDSFLGTSNAGDYFED